MISALACLLLAATQQPPAVLDDRLAIDLVVAEPDLVTPTGLAVDAHGRVFVIESNTHFPPKNYAGRRTDRILVLEDFGPDGRARSVRTFAEGFRYGMSLGFGKDGDLYFATRWEIFRFRGDERRVLVRLETKGDYPHNGLCGFAFDVNGDVIFGMGENLGAPYRLTGSDGSALEGGGEGGNVFRCRADGAGVSRVATGVWNPFHLTFDSKGRLFLVDNDPDSRPPCRLLHVIQGGDYGFKFRNGRKGLHPFTSWNGELPGTLPMVCGTGEAPSGIVEYAAAAFPPGYRGTLLGTSWGDHLIQRFTLVSRGASFSAKVESIVKGGEHFRPVSIAVAPDGSVFFSDWVDRSYNVHGKGRVWRLRAKAPSTSPAASLLPDDAPALKKLRAIEAATAADGTDAMVPLLGDPDPFLVTAAAATLARTRGAEGLKPLVAHRDARMRLGVLLALRRTGDTSTVQAFLEDADPAVRRAAIQWAAEAGLPRLAPSVEAAAARPPVTKELFEAYLAAMDALSGRLGQADQGGSESLLARTLDDANQPPAFRRLSLQMLRRDHPAVSVKKLVALAKDEDPGLRLEAVRALGSWPDEAAQEVLRQAMADPALRPEAIPGLSPSATDPRTRALLMSVFEKDPPVSKMDALRSLSGDPEAVRQVRELLKPGDDLLAGKIMNLQGKDPHKYVASGHLVEPPLEPGDAAAGERVFFHPRGPQCSVCHRVNGRGGNVGPDLSTIGHSLDRARIVDNIVNPSREVAPMFVAWRVKTKAGDVLDGRVMDEDSSPTGFVVLANAEGKITKLKNVDIEDRQPSTLSVMPDKLAERLTPAEFRDLVEYLAGLK